MNGSMTVQLRLVQPRSVQVSQVQFRFWSPSSISSSYVSVRAATEPSDTDQPHATATAWMVENR